MKIETGQFKTKRIFKRDFHLGEKEFKTLGKTKAITKITIDKLNGKNVLILTTKTLKNEGITLGRYKIMFTREKHSNPNVFLKVRNFTHKSASGMQHLCMSKTMKICFGANYRNEIAYAVMKNNYILAIMLFRDFLKEQNATIPHIDIDDYYHYRVLRKVNLEKDIDYFKHKNISLFV